MKFRTAYDHGERIGDIDFGEEPSLTVQAAKDECDINLIIDRANRGIYPNVRETMPRFEDVTGLPDYQFMLNAVMDAQDRFAALPAAVRSRFGNDPAQLLEFLGDVNNRDEAIRLGLIDPPAPSGAEAAAGRETGAVPPVVVPEPSKA